MRRILVLAILTGMTMAAVPSTASKAPDPADQVREAERAFAKSMADRDLDAFAASVADEAIFFGGKGPLRGKKTVVAAWARFFEGPDAPFSWEPETVAVLDSGTLGLTSGPVRDPDGKQIAIFQSIWRLEADGVWRVVFDRGCDYCPPAEAKP